MGVPSGPAGHAVSVPNARTAHIVWVRARFAWISCSSRICPETRKTAIARTITESKMPKMKTKASGKIKVAAAGKRHGMIKRSNKFIRDARGTMVLSDQDAKIVKKFM